MLFFCSSKMPGAAQQKLFQHLLRRQKARQRVMRRGGLRAAVPRQLQRRHLSVHLLPRRALEAARVPLRIRLQKVLPIVAQERGQVVLLSEQDRRCDPFGVGAVKLLRLLLLRRSSKAAPSRSAPS